jgi:chromosome segregation ATPase
MANGGLRRREAARDRIDRALTACEEINAVQPGPPPRWALDLIGELQAAAGTLVWEPVDTLEAHAELLDLQVQHLSTPPAAALAEVLGSLSRARGEVRKLREQLAAATPSTADQATPARSPEPSELRRLRAQVTSLHVEVEALRAEARAREAAAGKLLAQVASLREEVAAGRAEARALDAAARKLRGQLASVT